MRTKCLFSIFVNLKLNKQQPIFLGTNFVQLLLFIGIIGGAGIGLAYVVPIAVGMRWFPDKKGLITGLAVAGFGFGAAADREGAGERIGLRLDLQPHATAFRGTIFDRVGPCHSLIGIASGDSRRMGRAQGGLRFAYVNSPDVLIRLLSFRAGYISRHRKMEVLRDGLFAKRRVA